MRLKNFLLEYKDVITAEEANAIIRGSCSDYYKHAMKGKFLYRGVAGKVIPVLVKPEERTGRRPMSLSRIFMDLTDNLPNWDKYPARSKSIMATTDETHARQFSDFLQIRREADRGIVYYMFPFNGSTLAITPTKDFNLDSFGKNLSAMGIIGGMIHLSEILEDMSVDITHQDIDQGRDTYPQLVNLSKEIESIKKKNKKGTMLDLDPYGVDIPEEFKKALTTNTLLGVLQKIMDPESNGFKLISTKPFPSGNHEVWTDGNCVVIPPDMFVR